MTFDNGGLVVDGVKTSSAVSSALSAAPVDGRNQDCCGCVGGEPLGRGPREVEVVGGGYALFGGRWGNGETQVTPLRLEDMVLAQQQLEQEYSTSVSSELESERDREGERGEMRREGNFGGPAAGDLMVDETSLSAASVVRSVTAQSQTAFTARRSTVTGRQGCCVGVASVDFPSRSSVSDSRYPYPPAVKGGRMGHKKFDDNASEAAAFASDSVNGEREWGGQRGVGLWRGQTEERVSDLTGFGQSVTGEPSSEGQWGSSVCEGPKRRRLSSVSIAVPESHPERRGGEEWMMVERNVVAYPSASVPLQDRSSPHYSRPSCDTAIHFFGLQNGGISCRQKAVCGYPEEGGVERRMAKEGGKGLSEQGRVTKQVHPPRLSGVECNSGCVGVKRGGKKREHTGEVERNRHGNILCPHHQKRNLCKECGGKSICEHGRERSKCKECGGKGICEHGRQKHICKDCGGTGICEHGRRRHECKECGGKSMCEHGRIRSNCKECGGKNVCEHGRQRCRCKECGGKSICEHGRIRTACKECGGGSIYEHGSIRSQCKQCGGKSVCEHGRPRHQCKDCGGKGICEHGRIRSQCKQCGGKSVCEHDRPRHQCKDCGGKGICEHGRIRSRCKECGGKAICEHGCRRSQCKESGGKSVCEHGRQRYYCKDCGGGGICVHQKDYRWCHVCKQISFFPL